MDPRAHLIAIVDDDARIRTALLRLFTFAHYQAEAFRSADALLHSLSIRMPSCLVVDLHLPGTSGLQLLQQLVILQHSLPVIVITADDDERLERCCKALGSSGYFRKPLDCEALLDAVQETLMAA